MKNVEATLELRLSGPTGARVCDWRAYALLRDNVQHYAEQGRPSERFLALHSLEKAVDFGAVIVDAARLRGEVLRAVSVLRGRSLHDAAISVRTRAKLTDGLVGSLRGTVRARLVGWEPALPGPARASITSCAASFVSSVLALTGTAVDGDLLTVRVVEAGSDTGDPHATAVAQRGAAARAGPAVTACLLAALTLALGCGRAATEAPPRLKSDRPGQEVTEVKPREETEQKHQPIVAPPPAYGNKVVLHVTPRR